MNKRLYFLALLLCCGSLSAIAQTGQFFNYVKGAGATRLDLGIHVFHPCDGNDNGYIEITVNNANGGSALVIFLDGPGGSIVNTPILQGATLTFNATQDLPSGTYDFIIRDATSTRTINTFVEPAYPSIALQDLLAITITDNAVDLANDNCDATPDASISVDIDEGSLDVTGGGQLTYNFIGPSGVIANGTISGTGPVTRTFTGLRGGNYILDVTDEYSVCTATKMWTVTDPIPDAFTISSTDLVICEGEDFILTIDDTDTQNGGIDVIYQAFEGATPLGAPVIGDGNPHNVTISGLAAGPHAIFVEATEGTCTPRLSTNTLNVTVNPVPPAPPTTFTPDEYCVGDAITPPFITAPTGGSTYTWYSDAGLSSTLTTGTNPTAAALGFSSAAANVTDAWVTETTAAGCEGPATQITLTVYALPLAPSIALTPDTYCVGNPITPPTVTAPVVGSTYKWYADAGLTTLLPTASGVAPTNAELGFSSAAVNVTTVYVTETTATNCEGPATPVTLTVNATPPAPGVTFTTNLVCQGDAITPPTITTPVVGSAYTWYSDAALTTALVVASDVAPTNAELGFDSSTPNTTTIYVTETTSLSCEGPSTAVTLTVRPTPVAPGVTFSPSTYCVGDAITPPTITAPVGGSTYRWYSDAGLTTLLPVAVNTAPTAAELGFSTAAVNTTIVYVTETNSVNCEGPSTTVTFTVNPVPAAPVVNFTPSVYCEGDVITPPVVTGPVGGSTYKWYSDAALTVLLPTVNGVTPTAAELGFDATTANTTTVYVTETNATNCEGASTTVTLVVNPTPGVPVVTFNPNYCVGDAITPPSITTPVPGSTYTWYSDPGLTIVLATTPSPANVALGFSSAAANSTTVYVTETNSSSCESASTAITLVVTALPVAPVVTFAPATYCQGEAITPPVVNAPVVGSTYNWYSDVTLTTLLTTATNPANAAIGFSSATPNVTTVYVTEVNAASCEGPATAVTLTVNPTPAAPVVSFSPATYCEGDPITPPTIVGPVGGSSYNWYADAALTTLLVTSTAPTNVDLGFSSVAPLTKDIFVTEVNASGCEGPSTQITLIVNARPVAPGVTFAGSPFCESDPFTAPVISAPVGTSTYTWFSDAGLTTIVATGAAPAAASLGFTTAVATTITVFVTETNLAGCQGPATSVTMVVNPRPLAPGVTFNAGPYCTSDPLTAPTITAPVMGSVYRWYSDASLTLLLTTNASPTNASLNFSTATANTTTVYVTEVNSSNCESASTAVTLVVNEIPELVPAQATAACVGSPIGYEVQLSPAPAGTLLNWPDPDASPDTNAGVNVPYVPGSPTLNDVLNTAPGTVTYMITPTANGCTGATQAVVVSVDVSATAFAGNPEAICAGAVYQLSDATIGGAATEGEWTIMSQPAADGSLSSVVFEPDPSLVTFSGTTPGDYVLRLRTDDPPGACVGAESFVTITVTAVPVVAPLQAKTICGNERVDLEILMNPANQPANTEFSWPDPDGAGPALAASGVLMGTPGTFHITDLLVNNGSSNITVTYVVTPTVGLCVGLPENIVITVRPAPVVANGQAKTICSGDLVGHEILLSPANQPAGTTFSWPDPDGTGTGTSRLNVAADPAGTLHINDQLFNGTGAPVQIVYSIISRGTNGCFGVVRDINITVNPGAIAEAGNAQAICSNGTATLTGSSIGGLATSGTWSIVTGPTGGDGIITNGTATATPATATFRASVAGDYSLQLITDDPAGACGAVADVVVITVKSPGDPSCTGGTGTCASVNIAPLPTPATCNNSDGAVLFSINPALPLTGDVTITIDGTGPTTLPVPRTNINDPYFPTLPVGTYTYSIEYGDASCIKTGVFSIDRSGTIGTPVATNIVDPTCFGGTGTATIDAPGETGNLLEWSADGINWTSFIAGAPVAGLPAGTNLISVMKAGDPCAGGVMITFADPAEIATTFTATDASCNNNDGTIVLGAITGGTGPYTITLNGNAVNLPANNTFAGLTANDYIFVISDANGCSRTFNPVSVSFPGFVDHDAPVVLSPDCTGAGTNGTISIHINDPGTFQFAFTTNITGPEPATFNPVGGADIFINGLANATYAVWIKPVGAGIQCATKVSPIAVSGIYPVSFSATASDVLCFGDPADITVSAVTGAPGLPFSYLLTNTATNQTVFGTVSAAQATGAFTIPVLTPGPYSLLLSQSQSSINPACSAAINAPAVALNIAGPNAALGVANVTTAISFPDRASGSALVVVNPSGFDPYETRLELVNPIFDGQFFVEDWSAVELNGQNLKLESIYRNLYAGEYRLDLRDAGGCVKTHLFTIDVDTRLDIPNIFTPNGDGVNEVFYIRNLPTQSQIVITNRWGKEVFKSSDYQNDWTATNMADGIYYYRLTMNGESYSGWVEILRSGE